MRSIKAVSPRISGGMGPRRWTILCWCSTSTSKFPSITIPPSARMLSLPRENSAGLDDVLDLRTVRTLRLRHKAGVARLSYPMRLVPICELVGVEVLELTSRPWTYKLAKILREGTRAADSLPCHAPAILPGSPRRFTALDHCPAKIHRNLAAAGLSRRR